MTDRLAAALLAEALGLPRQPPPQPPLNQQLSPAERAEVADRELRLRAELARQAASRNPNSDPNPDPNPRPHPNPNPNQAEAAEEQRAEHARGMGELQREVRKLGKQADEYEVRRANLERAAEQLTLSLSLGLSLSLSLSLSLTRTLSLTLTLTLNLPLTLASPPNPNPNPTQGAGARAAEGGVA